jgi:putative oxidoreductase
MKYLTFIPRILLGLVFVIFGANFFLHFIPVPPPPADSTAAGFMGAIYSSGFLGFVKALQLIGGLLLLSGRFVPLAMMWLGPITVNVLLYHAFMAPQGLAVPIVMNLLAAGVVVTHWPAFAPLFQSRSGRLTADTSTTPTHAAVTPTH